MAQSDQLKWSLPGWRIEQRFAPGVLIGNWAEERYKFEGGKYNHTSTHRKDFKNNTGFQPDIMTRRAAMLQNEGLSNQLLFAHHNRDDKNNLVSWYDEHYNGKERQASDQLPESRHWDSHRLAWEPEKSDHPINGNPTNFGLHDKLKAKWDQEARLPGFGDYDTTYGSSFQNLPNDSFVTKHYAPPKALSTRMHTQNKINKDLHLRSVNIIQTPEQIQAPSRMATRASSQAIPKVSI